MHSDSVRGGDIQFFLRSVIHFFSSSIRRRSFFPSSSPFDPPSRRDPPPHSKDGCEMRTNPLSVSPPTPSDVAAAETPGDVLLLRACNFSVSWSLFYVLHLSWLSFPWFEFSLRFANGATMHAMSGQIGPVRRLPSLSVERLESNLPNEQCHGEIVEANQITPRSKKIDGGSLARAALAQTGDPFWPAAAARWTDRRTCQSGLALSRARVDLIFAA